MMVKIGDFLFQYRNVLFPAAYILLFFDPTQLWRHNLILTLVGFFVSLSGQIVRALTIGLVYIVRGGQNQKVYAKNLVTQGMFAHCRNPLYLGNFLILCGIAIAANSVSFLLIAPPFFLFSYLAIIAAEENYLKEKFGTEYLEYCEKVNRIVPGLSGIGKTLRGMGFNWKRLIVKEYGTTFTWSAGMICIVAKNIWLQAGYETNHEAICMLGVLLGILILAFTLTWHLKKKGVLRAA